MLDFKQEILILPMNLSTPKKSNLQGILLQ
jgi:hypothetical protein